MIKPLLFLGLLLPTGAGAVAQPMLDAARLADSRVGVSRLEMVRTADLAAEVSWVGTAQNAVLESTASLGVGATWEPVDRAVTLADGRASVSLEPGDHPRFFRLRLEWVPPGGWTTVRETSPTSGEGGVAVTRETIFRLSAPLAPDATLEANRLFAFAGGRKILSRSELSGDRLTATLFYLENLPADARVQVTFEGAGLFDANNLPVDLESARRGTPCPAARIIRPVAPASSTYPSSRPTR